MSSQTASRRKRLSWILPLGTLVSAGLVTTGVVAASNSDSGLPSRSAVQLLQTLHQAQGKGLSGTIVSNVDMGNDEVTDLLTKQVRGPIPEVLDGPHTLQLWYASAAKQRVAVLDADDEIDLFRTGNALLQCTNGVQLVTRSQLDGGIPPLTALALTPPALTESMLAAMDGGTDASVAGAQRVADRSAYELVLTPGSSSTLIGSVHIAVDGSTGVPLQVQVYLQGQSSPQIDVSYSSVTVKMPPLQYVTYSTQAAGLTAGDTGDTDEQGTTESLTAMPVTTIGTGWNAVAEYRLSGGPSAVAAEAKALGTTAVHGSWGKGHLLQSSLLSVLVTDGGRVLAGPVLPAVLYRAVAAG